MEVHRLHIIILFISFAVAITVLIDGVTYLTLAHSDFPSTESGKVAWTNLMMYEITVPVLSVFGLTMHVFGLHLDFIAYIPETTAEVAVAVTGSLIHALGWLITGSMWTACEVGTLNVKTLFSANGTQSIVVTPTGPAFCPQYKFVDGGLSLQGPIPKVKIAFGWVMFVLSLASLIAVGKGWAEFRRQKYQQELLRRRRTMQVFEMDAIGSGPGKSWVVPVRMEGYETKVV